MTDSITIPKNAEKKELRQIASEVASVLKTGGIIAFPADTVWGLAVSALSLKGLSRLRSLKGRKTEHPFPMYLSSDEEAWKLTTAPSRLSLALAQAFWPGKLTMVLPLRGDKFKDLAADDGTIGIRVPSSLFLRLLVEETKAPVINTSANISGSPPLGTAREVMAELGGGLELMVKTDEEPHGLPSTVIRPSDGNFSMLREGAISKKSIENVLNVALRATSQ